MAARAGVVRIKWRSCLAQMEHVQQHLCKSGLSWAPNWGSDDESTIYNNYKKKKLFLLYIFVSRDEHPDVGCKTMSMQLMSTSLLRPQQGMLRRMPRRAAWLPRVWRHPKTWCEWASRTCSKRFWALSRVSRPYQVLALTV